MKKDHTTILFRALGILFLVLVGIGVLCYNFTPRPKQIVPIAQSHRISYPKEI